jgi:hypothetical protein
MGVMRAAGWGLSKSHWFGRMGNLRQTIQTRAEERQTDHGSLGKQGKTRLEPAGWLVVSPVGLEQHRILTFIVRSPRYQVII